MIAEEVGDEGMAEESGREVGMVDELGGKLMMWETMQLNDNILVMK